MERGLHLQTVSLSNTVGSLWVREVQRAAAAWGLITIRPDLINGQQKLGEVLQSMQSRKVLNAKKKFKKKEKKKKKKICLFRLLCKITGCGDFPGGAVVKNPPANAGDIGSSPGPGRHHMLRSN